MRAVVTDVRRPGHRTQGTDVGEVVTRVLSHANQMSHTHHLSLIGHTLTLLINYNHAMESDNLDPAVLAFISIIINGSLSRLKIFSQ